MTYEQHHADVRSLGKGEVVGSIPTGSTAVFRRFLYYLGGPLAALIDMNERETYAFARTSESPVFPGCSDYGHFCNHCTYCRPLGLAAALMLAAASPALAGSGMSGMDAGSATCRDVIKGHPRAGVAFSEGYILGLMFKGESPADDHHVDELIAFCHMEPDANLFGLIHKLKSSFQPNTDEVVK